MGREKQLPGIRYFRLLRMVKHFLDILVCEDHAKAGQKLNTCMITTTLILSNIYYYASDFELCELAYLILIITLLRWVLMLPSF